MSVDASTLPTHSPIKRFFVAPGALPFVASVFLGAVLIFLVQPMFAKMATPLLGGSPSVWNVSLVCFQAALLLGYAYAHALARLRSVRLQVTVHGVLFLAGLICLPMSISGALGDPDPSNPTLWLIGIFALSVALPYAVVSATAPLIQSWYAKSGESDADDPYHLYAASNVGSLLGLALYPLVLEPLTRLADQTLLWSVGYGLLLILILTSGALVAKRAGRIESVAQEIEKAPLSWIERGRWLALAFIPSSLLVGVTSHITTDLAAAPFLWVPPLTLYLLTFVFVFSKQSPIRLETSTMLMPLAVGAMLLTLPRMVYVGTFLEIAIALLGLFVIAMVAHGQLAARRPHVSRLTEFYLLMSLGGVLGGSFNALLAPVVFDTVLEYPIMLIAALLLLPQVQRLLSPAVLIGVAIAGIGLIGAMLFAGMTPEKAGQLAPAIMAPGLIGLVLARKAPVTAAMCGCAVFSSSLILDPLNTGESTRGFFGIVRVVEMDERRVLMHGTTNHGAQSLREDNRYLPLTYYAPETPIGQTFQQMADTANTIGVVGLGVGSVACYAEPNQEWVMYEIDPIVVDIATDPAQFSYLSECTPDARIEIGDARITLGYENDGYFDLLLLDAFSSNVIPLHLVTHEAFKIYLDKLSDDGVFIGHISNRVVSLKQVFARLAEAEGVYLLHQAFVPTDEASDRGVNATEAVMVTKSVEARDRALATGLWTEIEVQPGRIWTDDYSNIIGAMMEKNR